MKRISQNRFAGKSTALCNAALSLLISVSVSSLATGQQPQQERKMTSLDSLAWLAGSWGSTENGTQTEEFWMAPKSGLMAGVNRTVSAKGKTTFEYFRIEQTGDAITLLASPSGKPATPFALIESGKGRAVFENKEHDFPQRIIYQRENNQMVARIEGVIEGKEQSMDWNWKRLESKPTNAANPKPKSEFHGLRTVVYKVKELEQAKQWYAKVLGIQPYFDEPFYVGFSVGGYELGLDPDMDQVKQGDNQPVYWGVDDCAASYKRLIELGAKKHSEPQDVGSGIMVATVVDPQGNIFGVIQNPHFKIDP